MKLVAKEPSLEKAPERALFGRLELLLMLLQQLPGRQRPTWDWQKVLHQFVTPSLLSQHSNVRWMAQQVITILYQLHGEVVRDIFLSTV